ncbi:MAG: thrombospondin type 3 repeat-containing protein [bacterium]
MFDETPSSSGSPFNPYEPSATAVPSEQGANGGAQENPSTPPQQAEAPVQQIHAMPGKFLQGPGHAKGGNRMLLILIIVLAVALLGGGAVLYLRFTGKNTNAVNGTTNSNTNATNTNAVGNANTAGNANALNTSGNTNSTANANTNSALPLIVKGTLTNPDTNEKISTATLTIPAGALPTTVSGVAVTTLSAKVGAYATSEKYQAVGAVFILTPAQTKLSKDATIEITYTDSELLALGFSLKESDLTIASWRQNEWVPLNSLVDTKSKTVTATLDEFPSDGLAVVVPKPASTNTNTSTNTSSNTNTGFITPSLDSDGDGLTNQEEVLYGTDAGSPDTDRDGYKDGQEILAGYNPNGAGKLVTSSLVRVFENATYRYSLNYPTSWIAGSLNADKLVTFTSVTGEFVQVSVQENTGKLTAREWYLSLNPSVNASQLHDVTVGKLAGVIGPDALNVFLADAKYIYQITYNVGMKTEANYGTTFIMMYTSFVTGITPTTTNTNTNAGTTINTNTTNSNSNVNTNINASSG